MDLDRGLLSKIDRKVLSGLGHDEMVRLPASEALWSTWRRYCDALEISMGRAIAALMQHELRSVVGEWNTQPVFLVKLENGLAERQRALDAREQSLEMREQRIRQTEPRIRANRELQQPPGRGPKVDRNDRCPCGSGLKYKRCHGP